MGVCESIINEFFYEYEIDQCEESFEQFILVASSIKKKNVDVNLFQVLSIIPNWDKVRINILEDDVPIVSYSTGDDIKQFKDDIQLLSSEEDNINCKVSVIISKGINEQVITIYSVEKFIDYLEKLSLVGLFEKFSELLKLGYITFFCIDDEIRCNSKSFSFTKGIDGTKKEFWNRNYELKMRNKTTNFLNSSQYPIIPGDFNLEECSEGRLEEIFNSLRNILSIISISDISYIQGNNTVNISLSGYKDIQNIIDYKSNENCNLDEYYEVYKWLIDSGNLLDKLCIARNVISISVSEGNLQNIESRLMPSIESNYKIYLRDNVKEYLEIKAKASEFIFELCNKLSDLANTIGKALGSNIIACITFYTTIILMNILNTGKLENIFTKEIVYISFAFIVGSFIYMVISVIQVYKEFKRHRKMYDRIKANYEDVLDSRDIARIFKNDAYINEDKRYVINKTIIATIGWILILGIMTYIIYILRYKNIIN